VQRCAALIEHHPSNLLARYDTPLVLKEALVNSTTRVPSSRTWRWCWRTFRQARRS